jgi:hypothetical protein
MIGDVKLMQIQSGSTVSVQEVAVSGRAAIHKRTGAKVTVVGLRAGFGPKDRNAWILNFPVNHLNAASRADFKLV